MDLIDFLPVYPEYEINEDFPLYEEDLTTVIQKKKEFSELALGPEEQYPEKPGDLLKHQQFIRRFMSGYTPYNGILLWHAVGTGKTGSAIAVAEGLKKFGGTFEKALILVRSSTFIRNFKNEIAYVMTSGEYLPKETPNMTKEERTRRINKLISTYYEFDTFQVFSKTIQQTANRKRLLDYYSNRLIIIDEVHNIRDKGDDTTYSTIHTFLHEIKDSKVVLLTATPIRDVVPEFASIMNLILPLEQQLPIGKEFMNTFFSNYENPIVGGHYLDSKKLIPLIKGRISYLQPAASDVVIENKGELTEFSPLPLVNCPFGDTQGKKFIEDYKSEDDAGLYTKSVATSLSLRIGNTARGEIKKKKTIEEKLEIVKTYSSKYHYILDYVHRHPEHNIFIYCEKVKETGIETLAMLFKEVLGFQPTESFPIKMESKRFGVVTAETPDGVVENIIKEFNKPENAYGKNIQVIIGSAVIGEGRSLLSVRDIFITSPFWNFTDMDQAIGRGIRYGSHRYLRPEDRMVSIHRLRGYYDKYSIDDHMIKIAYAKDILSKEIEASARTAAIDCNFNYRRNLRQVDFSRQCLYRECEYKCDSEMKDEELVDTYNLFYTEKEYQDIKTQVQKKFSEAFEYELEELLAVPEISRYSNIVVLRSLTSMIQRNEPFLNPLGFVSYIKEEDGVFFLVHDYSISSDKSYVYDTKLGQKRPIESFSNYVEKYPIRHLKRILESGFFERLPLDIKIEILRGVLYETHILRSNSELYQSIKDNMSELFIEDEKTVSILPTNEILNFETGQWMEKRTDDRDVEKMIAKIKQLDLGYFGVDGKLIKIVTYPIRKAAQEGATLSYKKNDDLITTLKILIDKFQVNFNISDNKTDNINSIKTILAREGILVDDTMRRRIVEYELSKEEKSSKK